MKKIVFMTMVCFLTCLNPIFAGDKIIWPYFAYPPWFISEKEPPEGILIDIQNLLAGEMPGYEHEYALISPARFFKEMERGKNHCVAGLLKTAQRESFLYYSELPCRITIYGGMIIRKKDIHRFGNQTSVSLIQLLKEGKNKLGTLNNIVYFKDINEILVQYANDGNTTYLAGRHAFDQLMKMLDAERVDYILAEPFLAYYLFNSLNLNNEIAILSIKEVNNSVGLGYVACTKNEWGDRVIKEINAVLKKTIPEPRFLNIYEKWIDPAFFPKIENLYHEKILKPALGQ
jgi:uncharacterized protein (TIGR02285 family)